MEGSDWDYEKTMVRDSVAAQGRVFGRAYTEMTSHIVLRSNYNLFCEGEEEILVLIVDLLQ